MFLLASQPFDLSGNAILHIVHRRELRNPNVAQFIARVECTTAQKVNIGEHILSEPRFRHFDTVIIHDCSYGNLRDYYLKLKSSTWVQRFMSVARDDRKTLVVVGTALNLIGPKLTIIPFRMGTTLTSAMSLPKVDRNRIDIHSPGLNIFTNACFDCDFTFKYPIKEYMKIIQSVGRSSTVYCLDNRAILDDTGKVLQGSVYILNGNSVKTITRPELQLTQQQLSQENKKTISTNPDEAAEQAPVENVVQKGTNVPDITSASQPQTVK